MAITLNPNTPKRDNDPYIWVRAHLPCEYNTPCNPPSRSEVETLGGEELDAALNKVIFAAFHALHNMLKFQTQARFMRGFIRERESLFSELMDVAVDGIAAFHAGEFSLEDALTDLDEKASARSEIFLERLQKIQGVAHMEYWGYTFPGLPVREGKTRLALVQPLNSQKKEEIRNTLGSRLQRKAFPNSIWKGDWDRWCVPECYLCGQRLDYLSDIYDVDHIVPESKGGTSDSYNLLPVHRSCNADKGDMPASEYMRKTRWAKDKANCSGCRKLLPSDEMECCVPSRKWSDKVRQLRQPFYYYCADCLSRRKWQQPSSRLCVCESPDHHNNPPAQW